MIDFTPDYENALLSQIFTKPSLIEEHLITTDLFEDKDNRTFFEAMQAARNKGLKPDLVSISDELDRAGHVELITKRTWLTKQCQESRKCPAQVSEAKHFINYLSLKHGIASNKELTSLFMFKSKIVSTLNYTTFSNRLDVDTSLMSEVSKIEADLDLKPSGIQGNIYTLEAILRKSAIPEKVECLGLV